MRTTQVHVHDVCQALWHLSTAGKRGHVYNLVDKNDTSASHSWVSLCLSSVECVSCLFAHTAALPPDQAKINAVLEDIFHIRTGFIGKLVSNLARVRPDAFFAAGDLTALCSCCLPLFIAVSGLQMRLGDVVDDANEKHLQPWADLCAVRL